MTAASWSPWRISNYYYFERVLAPFPATHALADLGAGDLQFEKLFTRFSYTGVDFQKFPKVNVVADLTKDIPLKDASADIITMSNTVEHIPNTMHLLKECRRILKPGGTLVGTIPFLVQVHQAPYDFNRYTNFQLERMLTEAGFRDVTVEPLGSLVDVYDTLERKFFDHALAARKTPFLWILRKTRRFLTKTLVRKLARGIHSNAIFTEGYGFTARV